MQAALDAAGVDCGMWALDDKDEPENGQSLRYDQFIAPLVRAVQELAAWGGEALERIQKRNAGSTGVNVLPRSINASEAQCQHE